MTKSCDNCYWLLIHSDMCMQNDSKPKENVCEKHNYECSLCDDEAEYISDNEAYCAECLIQSFSLEESTETHYSLDGTYLGSDDDMDGVIDGIRSCGYAIEELED